MAMEYNAKINKKNDIAGKNYHRRPKKKNTNPPKTSYIEKKCVSLQSLSTVKKAVSKKSIATLSLLVYSAKFYSGGWSITALKVKILCKQHYANYIMQKRILIIQRRHATTRLLKSIFHLLPLHSPQEKSGIPGQTSLYGDVPFGALYSLLSYPYHADRS